MKALWADTAFLAGQGVMDYSLIVGVDMPNGALVVGIIDFLRQVRQDAGGDKPTVVFCTVENDLARIREALDAGADEYIMKPFDGDIIAAKFAEVGLA